MLSELIERMARAICTANGQIPEGLWRTFIPEATAALAAIREPTERMVDAAINRPTMVNAIRDEAREVFMTMIDAELGDG